MNKQEEKLFEEIQVMVEELPWDHKTNIKYYESCVHEAAHGVVSLFVSKRFNNLEDLRELVLEVCVYPDMTTSGVTIRRHGSNKKKWLFSIIPVAIDKIRLLSGVILTDEFWSTYYGFNRVLGSNSKLNKEYGGSRNDIARAEHLGILGTYLDNLFLRLCYKNTQVRLLHLILVHEILKNNGKFVISDPEKYVKEKEL